MFVGFVRDNWEDFQDDDEAAELLIIYGELKTREVELLEIFGEDDLLETDSFPGG